MRVVRVKDSRETYILGLDTGYEILVLRSSRNRDRLEYDLEQLRAFGFPAILLKEEHRVDLVDEAKKPRVIRKEARQGEV